MASQSAKIEESAVDNTSNRENMRVAATNAPRVNHVLDIAMKHVEGKDVLDVGCIGHDLAGRMRLGTFYQTNFRERAAYLKGFDILPEAVAEAKKLGYNVVEGNAETFVDDRKYDTIFAGELIEHLSNPGLFLECCAKNLKEGGVVILTTPNAFSLSKVLRVIARRTNEPPVNPEHTFYFTPATLKQLYSRYGFTAREFYYSDYDYGKRKRSWKRMLLGINTMLCKMMPHFSQSMIVVLSRS